MCPMDLSTVPKFKHLPTNRSLVDNLISIALWSRFLKIPLGGASLLLAQGLSWLGAGKEVMVRYFTEIDCYCKYLTNEMKSFALIV